LAAQQDLFLEKDSVLFSLTFSDLEFYLHLRSPNEFWHLFQSFLIESCVLWITFQNHFCRGSPAYLLDNLRYSNNS